MGSNDPDRRMRCENLRSKKKKGPLFMSCRQLTGRTVEVEVSIFFFFFGSGVFSPANQTADGGTEYFLRQSKVQSELGICVPCESACLRACAFFRP